MTFTHTLAVRFRDCDLYQHVNNAVYLTYFEEARAAFWRELMGDAFGGFDFLLAEAVCTYLSPARFGEVLDLTVTVTQVGGKSFHLAYAIAERASRREIARGRTVQVMFDHERQVTLPIDDALRARLAAFTELDRPA